MTVHIGAKPGDIAEVVLLPGDPLRAKHIAEHYLENAFCYSEVRGMYGFTGTYRGMRVSVQGTGMGMPSASIYIHELIAEYGAKVLVRVGTCGALREDVAVRDLVIAQAACTDSAMYNPVAGKVHFAPIGTFELIARAVRAAEKAGCRAHVGNVFSTDAFYADDPSRLRTLGAMGVLAVEMETAALYTLAAKFGVRCLSLLTVSDHVLTGEETTALERQTAFGHMAEVALAALAG